MKTKKGDLVEVEFTAMTKDGIVFDTTSEEEAKKNNIFVEGKKFEPIRIFIGEREVVKGFDKALEDKEIQKEYEVEVRAEEAYGPRNASLIKVFPIDFFETVPSRGTFVNVDGIIAKVISVTPGRVLLDFNNPLAGKDVIYKFKILKIIEDEKEKLEELAKKSGTKIEIQEENGKFKIIAEKFPLEFREKAKKLVKKEIIFEEKQAE